MCVYIFAGRFQPFHKGHMQVFQQICEKLNPTDLLVLGVIAPFHSTDIKDMSFLESSKEHHLPNRNPWDVAVPLSAISKVVRSSHYQNQIITTLLPRPEYGWETIKLWFPQKRIWVIPFAEEEFDEKKSEYFTKMGDKVIRFEDKTGISGRELREYYEKNLYEEFAVNLPEGLADIYFSKKLNDSAEIDFQKRAENFERHSRWVVDKNINNVPKNFFQQHNVGNLLDLGGGTGYLSWYLYQHLKSKINEISLVDISRNMLDEAEKKKNYPVKTYNTSIETFCKMTPYKFDTILMRQVLHYVDDVEVIVKLLKNVLNENGIIYIGQILVDDSESKDWHNELMQDISSNRRRTFIYNDFINYFKESGFEIIEVQTSNYEENFTDLFERRIKESTDTTLESLKSKMETLAANTLKEKMSIKFEDNNLYFTVKFCHLFLRKTI